MSKSYEEDDPVPMQYARDGSPVYYQSAAEPSRSGPSSSQRPYAPTVHPSAPYSQPPYQPAPQYPQSRHYADPGNAQDRTREWTAQQQHEQQRHMNQVRQMQHQQTVLVSDSRRGVSPPPSQYYGGIQSREPSPYGQPVVTSSSGRSGGTQHRNVDYAQPPMGFLPSQPTEPHHHRSTRSVGGRSAGPVQEDMDLRLPPIRPRPASPTGRAGVGSSGRGAPMQSFVLLPPPGTLEPKPIWNDHDRPALPKGSIGGGSVGGNFRSSSARDAEMYGRSEHRPPGPPSGQYQSRSRDFEAPAYSVRLQAEVRPSAHAPPHAHGSINQRMASPSPPLVRPSSSRGGHKMAVTPPPPVPTPSPPTGGGGRGWLPWKFRRGSNSPQGQVSSHR